MISASDIIDMYMRENGLSQHQFASQLEVSQAYINKLLKRELFMSTEKALLIESCTGISARELLVADVDFKLQKAKHSNAYVK